MDKFSFTYWRINIPVLDKDGKRLARLVCLADNIVKMDVGTPVNDTEKDWIKHGTTAWLEQLLNTPVYANKADVQKLGLRYVPVVCTATLYRGQTELVPHVTSHQYLNKMRHDFNKGVNHHNEGGKNFYDEKLTSPFSFTLYVMNVEKEDLVLAGKKFVNDLALRGYDSPFCWEWEKPFVYKFDEKGNVVRKKS